MTRQPGDLPACLALLLLGALLLAVGYVEQAMPEHALRQAQGDRSVQR